MARANPSERPPDEAQEATKRGRILGAAMSLFIERGFARTSTLDIATRARVSKRELYAQFSSKEEMLRICIAERSRQMRLALELPPARDRRELAEILVAFGTASLAEVCKPEVIAVYRLAVLESERSPTVARTLHEAGRESNVAALLLFLGRAQEAGLVEAGEVTAMAGQFLRLLWGDFLLPLLLRVVDPPSREELEARARQVTETVLALHPAPRRRRVGATQGVA